MKSNKLYNKAAKVFALIPFTLCLLLLLASCSNDNLSDLQLAGNCAVESIELDGKYTGVVDPVSRTVKIKVPVSFLNKSAMKVTALNISEGAKANIAVGDVVDFSAAKVMHITRGDLYLDWTINVKNDEAKIKSFIINDTYKASINEEEHTITAFLPATVDIKKAIPTITYSEDATISPLSGVQTDFSEPVTYTVTDNTATATYVATIKTVSAPSAIFLGSAKATTMDELVPEEKEACKWMLANIENSMFVSWDELKAGNVDLSKCKIIWWHWQGQPSENMGDFESAATSTAMGALNTLTDFYKNGGAFILSRAAVNFAAKLGAIKDNRCANNCWGASDDGGDVISAGGEWGFKMKDANHPVWKNMILKDGEVKTVDAGYTISNCTSQWGMWGDYDKFDQPYTAGHEKWVNLTGCRILGYGGGEGQISVWEAPAYNGTFGKGGIICFGSGCYDWWSPTSYTSNYHDNVGIMTGNAFDYLTK